MNAHNSSHNALEQFSAIWRRRWGLIIAVFTLVAVPSICAIVALPDVYEAEATVIPSNNALTQYSGLNGSGPSAFDSVTEQVLSRGRLVSLIKKYDLYPDSKPGSVSATAAMRKDILIKREEGGQSRGGLPYAFNVIFWGSDPQKVAAVANSLAASYGSVAREMQGRDFANAADTLKSRLDLLRKKLDHQQTLIDRYQNEHKGQLPDQQSANLAAIQRLGSRLQDNDAKQLRLMQSRTDLLQRMGDSGPSALPQLEQRLADLKLRYTDKYPEVVELRERIATLKAHRPARGHGATARTPIEGELAQIDSQLTALQSEEAGLRSQINVYQQHLDNVPLTAQRLRSLTQGYSETSDLYATLLKRYEQVHIVHATSAQDGPQFQVLEAAMVPTLPSGPGRVRLLVICLVLSFGLAGLSAAMAEQFDTSFHSLEELQAFTSLPVLATVPVIAAPRDIHKKRRRLGITLVLVLTLVGVLGAGATLYSHDNQFLAQKFSHHVGSSKG